MRCSGNGTYECAGCTCNPGFFGKKCECDATSLQTTNREDSCKK